MRILLVEDDKITATFVRRFMKEKGYIVDYAEDGQSGLDLARENKDSYSVIILDVMLPLVDGLKICKTIRKEGDKTPILILSGRDETENKVEGLNAGGDDYLTKPFDMDELIARIRALERRGSGEIKENSMKLRHVELDPLSYEVKVSGKIVEFTRLEFRLLHLLMSKIGEVVTRSEILEKVWEMHGGSLISNSISVHIKQLRKKIKEEKDNPMIVTVRGAGYKMVKE